MKYQNETESIRLCVFSGACFYGEVGQPTDLFDLAGNRLHVGDIVQAYKTLSNYRADPSVVVQDGFTHYQGGEVLRTAIKDRFFVMGLKSVCLEKDRSWEFNMLKKHTHIIEGEKWPDYKFNYKMFDLSLIEMEAQNGRK